MFLFTKKKLMNSYYCTFSIFVSYIVFDQKCKYQTPWQRCLFTVMMSVWNTVAIAMSHAPWLRMVNFLPNESVIIYHPNQLVVINWITLDEKLRFFLTPTVTLTTRWCLPEIKNCYYGYDMTTFENKQNSACLPWTWWLKGVKHSAIHSSFFDIL